MSSGTADKIIAKISREVRRQNQELIDLDNLVLEKQADIEEYDDMIVALDNKMKGYVDEINEKIQDVANAYEAEITAGCKSGLKWVKTGISSVGVGSTVFFQSTWTVVRIENTTFNKYGLQYQKKPYNRDYNLNIVGEYSGTVSTGKTELFIDTLNYSVLSPDEEGNSDILSFDELSDLKVGDFITDDVSEPTVFTSGALPTIVGFSSAVNAFSAGIKTSFTGSAVLGQDLIAIQSSTIDEMGLSIGDHIYRQNVTSIESAKEYSSTTIVGFATTSVEINVYTEDVGAATSTIVTQAVRISNNILAGVSTVSFLVGVGTAVPTIVMSSAPTGILTGGNFSFIRSTNLYTSFSIDKSPIDPVVVGIIGVNGSSGTGETLELVNNGNSNTVQSYSEVRGESKPAVGNGFASYRVGTTTWPTLPFTGGYAQEGDVGIGTSGFTPSTTSTPPAASGCATLATNVSNALTDRTNIIGSNIPLINKYIGPRNIIGDGRSTDQLSAWAYLQAKNDVASKISTNNNVLQTIKDPNWDLL
jgi:hypothetical protein